jgi:N-methylhydantoinase A
MPFDEMIQGPAIVESLFTTVVVNPGATATRCPSGSLMLMPQTRVEAWEHL